MTGDNRVRFCDHCRLNVYNISELSSSEAENLIASTEDRICARLFRRTDGTVLTKDCPVGLRALRRRLAKRTAAIFAAIVSLSSFAVGQHGSSKKGKSTCTPQTKITRTNATSNPDEKVLSGIVLDPIGAVIPGAKVKLINADAKEIGQTSTNDDGQFDFGTVAVGNYSLMIELPGFETLQVKNVNIEKGRLTNIEMILQPSGETTLVGVLMAEPRLIDTPPGTTIIGEKLIQRLPHQK